MSTTFILCGIIAALVILCLHYRFMALFYKDLAKMNGDTANSTMLVNKILLHKLYPDEQHEPQRTN